MSVAGETTISKLPFWKTVGGSYRLLFGNILSAIRYAWFQIALALAAAFALDWISWSERSEIDAIALEDEPDFSTVTTLDWGFYTLGQIDTTLPLLCVFPFFIAWHRMVILDTAFRSANVNWPTDMVRRYVTAAIILWVPGLLLLAALLSIFLFVALDTTEFGVVAVGFVIAFCALVFVIARFAIRLPGIAVGRADFGWRDAWHTGRGDTWRLGLGDILCALPLFLLYFLVVGVEDSADQFISALQSTFEMGISIISTLLEVGFFSLAYRHFFQLDQTG